MTFISPKFTECLRHFAQRVAGLRLKPSERIPVDTLRDRASSAYDDWGDAPGIYLFEHAGRIQYIGRALRGTGLRARVRNQCTSFGDPAWDRVIKDPSATVCVVALTKEDWYWAASLEAYLIAELAPPFNKRDS